MQSGEGTLLGVDGGGSKTAFLLVGGDGTELARHTLGPCDFTQIGTDGVREVIRAGIAGVLQGRPAQKIAFAFLGLPAFGENATAAVELAELPAEILGHRRYECANDMVCGWAGSLCGEDGINVVAGTGSIGYGVRDGSEARVGGWGMRIGDEGSGYWLGMEALRLYGACSDGREQRGILYGLLKQHLGLARDAELCEMVEVGGRLWKRAAVAALCPVIASAANSGDPTATRLFERAGEELARIADAVRRRLGYAAAERVVLCGSGGVFEASPAVVRSFASAAQQLAPGFVIAAPRLPPVVGAVLLAARRAGVDWPITTWRTLAAGRLPPSSVAT